MKEQSKKSGRMPSKKIARLALVVIVLAGLALGATAAVSLRKSPDKPFGRTPANNARVVRNPRAGAQDIPLNAQGGVRPLTPEEAQRMAEGLRQLANQSTDGLQYVTHADGSVSVDLQGRFQNLTLAKRNEQGTVTEACVDNPKAAAVFLEIDPQLVGASSDPISPQAAPLMKGNDQ
jgi:hypothetical protein